MIYNWKITVIKGLIAASMGATGSTIAYIAGLGVDPISGAVITIATGLLRMFENWLKNKNNSF